MRLIGSETHRAMHGNKSARLAKPRMLSHQRGTELSISGVVNKVYFDTKMPSVDVKAENGSQYRFLPFPGGIIDPVTGNLHGDFIQPIEGQKVMISYANGDINIPYISELIFRAGYGNDSKKYKNFPVDYAIKEGDIIRGHKSGGVQLFSDEKIETMFRVKVDLTGEGKIEQTPSGINLGKGGIGGVKSPVALVNENFVLTSLGLQPIQPAPTRTGPLQVTVKA